MNGVLRAQAIMEMQGFMKVLVDEADDSILGFTMIGPEAGEVMAVMETAMLADLPYTRLRDAVLTHRPWPKASARCSRKSRPAPLSRPPRDGRRWRGHAMTSPFLIRSRPRSAYIRIAALEKPTLAMDFPR